MGSKKKPTNRAKKTETTELLGEWVPVGKLSKRSDFKCNKDEGPIDSFHATILRMIPEVKEIMDVGVSKATNEFFEEKLTAYAKKRYSYLSDRKIASSVAMALLNAAPCDVPDAEDFVLYRRKK
jgi:hypothetical protein